MTAKSLFVLGFENVLHDEAKRAALVAEGSTTPAEGGAKSIAAILLAVAAVESAVNSWVGQRMPQYGIDEGTLANWRRQRISEVIKDIFGRFDPPVPVAPLSWYNGLCASAELRNHIAHYFPQARVPGTWPDRLAGFVTGRVLTPAGDDSMDWTSRLFVPTVAKQVTEYTLDAIHAFERIAWSEGRDRA